MKMNQLVFTLVLALAATLATTGCKKGTTKVTQLPGRQIGPGPETNPTTIIPPAPPFNPYDGNPTGNQNPTPANPGQIATAEGWKIEDMNQDRAALAAYTVHFAFDSATVKDKEQANIASVAQALTSDTNAKLLIEGHCDERGTEEYNRSLGERRALALREALAKSNIDPARIRTISYGKDKPADPGHDEAAWAKNRRGEFILLHPKAGA
jgi:peptidoglycan-associated lipoprotein